ncbi:MAG: ABC transporter permease [Phycisphaerales bacterium JB043]
MYQALLTRRYLPSRVMPMLAMVAVVLCSAMVLTVWSVMGGFLQMLLDSGRVQIGDVILTRPVIGIPLYEELISALEADPDIEAATGIIETPALLKYPYGIGIRTVQLVGVDGESYARVTEYADTVWWTPLAAPLPKDTQAQDRRLRIDPSYEHNGLALTEAHPYTGAQEPAIVMGVHVYTFNERTPGGWIEPTDLFMPDQRVTISVLPLSDQGVAVDLTAREFPVANEFKSGLYEIDANRVLIRLDALQEMLSMDGGDRIGSDATLSVGDPNATSFPTPSVIGRDPARVTSVLVRGVDGTTEDQVKARVEAVFESFSREHERAPSPNQVSIYTWQQQPGLAVFIGAVKKETALVLVLFSFISLTAVFLVFAIFWAMVSEKVRDIGILRAMGARRLGIAWIFVRYGLAIGSVGSVLGIGLAYLIVSNINPIHEWLGSALGIVVWDPTIYYFTTIPNNVNPLHVVIVWGGGVLFSVIGSLVPSYKAATLDPVRALRFE